VLADGEEEKGPPDNVQLDEVALDSDEGEGSPIKSSAKKEAKGTFCKQEQKDLAAADTYTKKWGNGDEEEIEWVILQDSEMFSLGDGIQILPDKVDYSPDFTEKELDDVTAFFFKYIFPDITGKSFLDFDYYEVLH
jgi:hypothetical protein